MAAQCKATGCGILGQLGNKGAVSVRLAVYNATICLVCAHLAAGTGWRCCTRRLMHLALDVPPALFDCARCAPTQRKSAARQVLLLPPPPPPPLSRDTTTA
jgi:hypothetical protein